MGWRFKRGSSFGSGLHYDFLWSFRPGEVATGKAYHNYNARAFQSGEMSGTSVFYKNAARDIFHTYSTYARGDELLLGTYNILDLTPNGRNETGHNNDLTDWVRHHDR